jgi:hypothetical protein
MTNSPNSFILLIIQNLDQVQAYVLVSRWHAHEHGTTPLPSPGRSLGPDQLRAIVLLYFQERLRLLQSIESLLLVGEGWLGSGAFAEAIEETLGSLLGASPDLEEVTFQALKDNLEGNHSGAVPGYSASLLKSPMNGGGGGFGAASGNFNFNASGALVGVGDTVIVPGMTATRSGRSSAAEDLAALERNVLLSILSLIYFYPRKQCTQQRFLELAKLFHTHLFAIPLPHPMVGSTASSPSHISVKLATLLLLEVLALDVDKALQVIARGEGPINETTNAFLAPQIQNEINNELKTWCPASSAPHAAIVLVWAAVLTLAGKHDDAAQHASKATEANALGALRDLSSPQGLQPAAVDMAGTIVYSAACTVLTAFTLDPCSGMSAQQAQQAVDMLCNIFTHHPALCDSFWTGNGSGNGTSNGGGHQHDQQAEILLANQPIRSFLESLSSLFPAYPLPLLRLLTALTAGTNSTSAAAAFLYLSRNTELTWLLQLPHPAIAASSENALSVVTTAEVDLPGAKGLTLYTNVVGEVLTGVDSSTGVCGAWPVWIPGWSGSSAAAMHAVKWHLPAEVDTRPWALLCRSFGALRAIQENYATNSSVFEAAVLELDASLSFLAAVCSKDPGGTAIHILRFEAPSTSGSGSGNGSSGGGDGTSHGGMMNSATSTGRDIISLACQTLATLADLPSSSSSSSLVSTTTTVLTSCFKICSAFAPVAAGRVANELLGALGITPLDVAIFTPASPPEAPILTKLIASEGATARFPATRALLQLLISLLQAGCPSPALAPLVSFVLQRIAPELNHWKYEDLAERWLLAERCLTIVRQALLVASSNNSSTFSNSNKVGSTSNGIVAAVTAVLQTDSGVAACLLPLVPPDAAVLETQSNSADYRTTSQVEAAEKCCIAWLRLIPVLLPPTSSQNNNSNASNESSLLLAPAAFLCGRPDGSRPPAAILLSFLAYPYFAAREKALVVRAMHCFVVAASNIAPDMPFLPLLPEEGAGMAPAAKAALVDALAPSIATSCEPLFEATCDVLAAAVMKHPSLVDALFFDSSLEKTSDGKENKGTNEGGHKSPLLLPSSSTKATNGTTTTSTAYSCLDALWSLLQRWETLLLSGESPFALAKAMQVIAALWQSGGPAYRAISVLQRQPGFWAVVIGILDSGTANSLDSYFLEQEGTVGVAAAEKWRGMKKECWKIAAETAAMHVLAAECFVWRNNNNTATSTTSSSQYTMPSELYEFTVQGKLQAVVPRLLERYCLVLPHVTGLESDAARLATATAAQLLEISIHDHALWASVQAGPCLVSKLASITEPELHNCKDQAQVAAGLHSIAAAALGAAGDQAVQSRPVLRALAECLLLQAEIPQRMAPIAHYGSNYIYDSSLLGRRIGAALAQETPLLGDLKNMLGAVSVAFALEDVRADAATALDALVAVADAVASTCQSKQKKSATTGERNKAETVQDVAVVLTRVVETLLSTTLATQATATTRTATAEAVGGGSSNDRSGNSEDSSSLRSLHLASAASAAQAALVIIRSNSSRSSSSTRTTASPFAAGATPLSTAAAAASIAPEVVESTLSLTAKWFETSGSLVLSQSSFENHRDDRELIDSISKCLLAAALHAVSSCTAHSSSSTSKSATTGETPAQHAAQRLLPALLTIISGNTAAAVDSYQKHAEAAASLSAALLDRFIPSGVWLPVLSHHLHFGRALGTSLEAMNHAASSAATANNATTNKEEREDDVKNKHGAVLEAVLLLALQVTQTPSGATLLTEQGVLPLLLSLAAWLQSPPPGGNLLGVTTTTTTTNTAMASTAVSMFSIKAPTHFGASSSPHVVIDYSNAYSIVDGSFTSTLPHRLWCAILSLLGLLTATAPGAPAVVSTALQLLVGMDPRIQLAIEPPEGNAKQPVTLAMAQETRYSLFLLYGVVKMASGQYRVALPHALPALRRASASLLRFLASMEVAGDSDETVVCVAVTESEKALVQTPAPSTALSGGWFGVEACCTTTVTNNNGHSAAQLQSLEGIGLLNGFTFELAEQLYSSIQYALAFQVAVAPEVSEAEAEHLGPEWPDATTLTTLCERCIEIIDPACAGNVAAQPAVRRILKMMISILKLSLQLLDVMVPRNEAAAKMVRGLMRESEAAVERGQAILATYTL